MDVNYTPKCIYISSLSEYIIWRTPLSENFEELSKRKKIQGFNQSLQRKYMETHMKFLHQDLDFIMEEYPLDTKVRDLPPRILD